MGFANYKNKRPRSLSSLRGRHAGRGDDRFPMSRKKNEEIG